jgi:hypothetical protein
MLLAMVQVAVAAVPAEQVQMQLLALMLVLGQAVPEYLVQFQVVLLRMRLAVEPARKAVTVYLTQELPTQAMVVLVVLVE